jgi:hypothetical protein
MSSPTNAVRHPETRKSSLYRLRTPEGLDVDLRDMILGRFTGRGMGTASCPSSAKVLRGW